LRLRLRDAGALRAGVRLLLAATALRDLEGLGVRERLAGVRVRVGVREAGAGEGLGPVKPPRRTSVVTSSAKRSCADGRGDQLEGQLYSASPAYALRQSMSTLALSEKEMLARLYIARPDVLVQASSPPTPRPQALALLTIPEEEQ
jgi:hypothetical protein